MRPLVARGLLTPARGTTTFHVEHAREPALRCGPAWRCGLQLRMACLRTFDAPPRSTWNTPANQHPAAAQPERFIHHIHTACAGSMHRRVPRGTRQRLSTCCGPDRGLQPPDAHGLRTFDAPPRSTWNIPARRHRPRFGAAASTAHACACTCFRVPRGTRRRVSAATQGRASGVSFRPHRACARAAAFHVEHVRDSAPAAVQHEGFGFRLCSPCARTAATFRMDYGPNQPLTEVQAGGAASSCARLRMLDAPPRSTWNTPPRSTPRGLEQLQCANARARHASTFHVEHAHEAPLPTRHAVQADAASVRSGPVRGVSSRSTWNTPHACHCLLHSTWDGAASMRPRRPCVRWVLAFHVDHVTANEPELLAACPRHAPRQPAFHVEPAAAQLVRSTPSRERRGPIPPSTTTTPRASSRRCRRPSSPHVPGLPSPSPHHLHPRPLHDGRGTARAHGAPPRSTWSPCEGSRHAPARWMRGHSTVDPSEQPPLPTTRMPMLHSAVPTALRAILRRGAASALRSASRRCPGRLAHRPHEEPRSAKPVPPE